MNHYPVHYSVEQPTHFSRPQLLIRILAFVAIGMLGISFGGALWFLYLVLPVFAAIRLGARGQASRYVDDDGPRVFKVLHWFAVISAWAALVVENLPTRRPEERVSLIIDEGAAPHPNATSPIWRVFTGLPSALVLIVLSIIGVFAWLWAALSILINERVATGAFNYLVGLQRWSLRLLAYQAALVDDYPPFSFSDHRHNVIEANAAS